MATVPITAEDVRDANGQPDNRAWSAYSPTYREGGDGGIITPVMGQPQRPVAGKLTLHLEPGPAVIRNPDGKSYLVTVPNSPADLWDVIEAAVAFPPETSAELLAVAVGQYVEQHASALALDSVERSGNDILWKRGGTTLGETDISDLLFHGYVDDLIDAKDPGKNVIRAATKAAARAAIDAIAIGDVQGAVSSAIAAASTVVSSAATAVNAYVSGQLDLMRSTTAADNQGVHWGLKDKWGRKQLIAKTDGTVEIPLPKLAGLPMRGEFSPNGYIRGTKDSTGKVAEDAILENGTYPKATILRWAKRADLIPSRDLSRIDPPAAGMTQRQVVLTTASTPGFDRYYVESPAIFLDPVTGLLNMLYVGYDVAPPSSTASVGRATSADGLTWTKQGQFFTGSGVNGSPDKAGATGPVMVVENGVYHLFYIGLTEAGYEGGQKSLCHATATSLAGPWTRRGAIISTSGLGWRGMAIWHPNLVYAKGKWWLFFNASSAVDAKERCGVASADSLDGVWTVDDAHSPILPDAGHTTDFIWGGDPFVYRDNDSWRMVFSYVTSDSRTGDWFATTTHEQFPLGWQVRGQLTDTTVPNSGFKPWILRMNGRIFHYGTASNGIVVATRPGS